MEERIKQTIRCLKDNDIYNIFLRNYLFKPNTFNSHNILQDIEKSIHDSKDLSGVLNSPRKGWDWDRSFEGRDFWYVKFQEIFKKR